MTENTDPPTWLGLFGAAPGIDLTGAAERVQRIKAVLDAHQFNGAGPGIDASCHADGCGWTHPWDRPTHEMWDVHRSHVAVLIADCLAGDV